uniref:C3H1-type domain-containing protein n=1 Tax=Peronospora matthiolae TaxID=2874970 RepID=A0AAV1V3K0_9STRA
MEGKASPSTTSDESSAQMELNEEVPAQIDPKVEAPSQAKHQGKTPLHFDDEAGLFKTVCRTLMRKKKCTRVGCTYVHDKMLCQFFWKRGECKFGSKCRKNYCVTQFDPSAGGKGESAGSIASSGAEQGKKNLKKKKKNRNDKQSKGDQVNDHESTISTPKEEDASNSDKQDKENDTKSKKKKKRDKRQPSKKNTESFEPMTKPVDLRITFDLGSKDTQFSTPLTSRDVVLVPNLFSDYRKGELYTKLLHELDHCGIPREQLLKMWHGNDKIDGTHLIVDDRSSWKAKCPTFDLVTDRLKKFFNLDIKATRFNWYKDTSQWKPFHFDAAAVKPHLAGVQNFTVGISFGATRDAAFEHAKTKTVVSVPQPDGCVYAFSKDTNVIWRHGILQDVPVREEGRISVIAWDG